MDVFNPRPKLHQSPARLMSMSETPNPSPFFGIPVLVSPLAPEGRITLFSLENVPGTEVVIVKDAAQIRNIGSK